MVQYLVHHFFYRIFGQKGITFQRFFWVFSQAIFLATEQGPKPLVYIGDHITQLFLVLVLYNSPWNKDPYFSPPDFMVHVMSGFGTSRCSTTQLPWSGDGPWCRVLLEKPQQPDGRGALHAAARYGHAEAECFLGTLEHDSPMPNIGNIGSTQPCQTLNVWYLWGFPKIMVPQHGWFIMENPIKMDDLGIPLFLETPIYLPTFG